MQIVILLATIASFGALGATLLKLVGWSRAPLCLGCVAGVFLSSIYLPWIYSFSGLASPITCALVIACSYYTKSIWCPAVSKTSARSPQVMRLSKTISYNKPALVCFIALASPYVLFLIYSYCLVPVWSWDTLLYWAPLAIEVLAGEELPQTGHPSFGVYGLGYLAKLSAVYKVPVTGLLLFLQTTCGIVAVALLMRIGTAQTKILSSLFLCILTPIFYQACLSIGYFDLPVALCFLISLLILLDLREQTSVLGLFCGAGLIVALLTTSLALKTTALIPLSCFIFVTLACCLDRRIFILFLGTVALVIIYFFHEGFQFSILGREFSIDWTRNPVMIVPGLWTDILHGPAVTDVVGNFFVAAFINQSYSLIFLALILMLFLRAPKLSIEKDPRYLFVIIAISIEFILQMTVPYFFEGAASDTRFTRSMIVLPLILIALVMDEIFLSLEYTKNSVSKPLSISD